MLEQLAELQSGLAIVRPAVVRVSKAYPYVPRFEAQPPRNFWQNEWLLMNIAALQEPAITVRMQFLAGPAQGAAPEAHGIATAFAEALMQTLYPEGEELAVMQTLGGTCMAHTMRGANPTVGLVLRGEQPFIGAELLLDVRFWTVDP